MEEVGGSGPVEVYIGGLTHQWQANSYRHGMVWYGMTGTVQMQEQGGAGGAQPPPELSNSFECRFSLQRPGCHLRNG